MILVCERLFKVTISISFPYFEAYLIVIKIRGTFSLFLLFVGVRISTFHLLRISKSNVSFRTIFIWTDALSAIYAFFVASWSDF